MRAEARFDRREAGIDNFSRASIQLLRLFKIVHLTVAPLASNSLKGLGIIGGLSCRALPAGV